MLIMMLLFKGSFVISAKTLVRSLILKQNHYIHVDDKINE